MEQSTFIGIDVACQTLQIAYNSGLRDVDVNIANTPEAIANFVSGLPPSSHFVFEPTGVYSRKLEFILSQKGMAFSKVNPVKIKGFIHASGGVNKNDKQDARYIRQYGQKMAPAANKPLQVEDIERSRLRQTHSKFLKILQDIDTQIHVLDQEPLPLEDIRQSYAHIRQTIQEQKQKIETRLNQLQAPQAKQTLQLMKTVPGIGKTIAQCVYETVGSFEDFQQDNAAIKYFGLAPVTATSGTSVKLKHGICRTAVPDIRAKLYMGAGAAIRYDPNMKTFFERLRAKGKPYKVARVAVMGKIVKILFHVLKSNTPYDPLWENKKKQANQN